MSERVQRNARDRRDGALRREANARGRAQRSREQGDEFVARMHDDNAELQAAAADAAERRRLADVAVEGERLGEPREDVRQRRAG